jgi:hypothetical protein
VLRAAGETETTQENMQDWVEPDGQPGFRLLIEEEIAVVILFYLFSSALPILLNFRCICFVSFLAISFVSLIRMTSPQLMRIIEGLM